MFKIPLTILNLPQKVTTLRISTEVREPVLVPIVPAYLRQVDEIRFLFTYMGQPLDLSSATVEIEASLDDQHRWVDTLTPFSPIPGSAFLPPADYFDSIGDWKAIAKITQGSETFFTEQFMFRVSQPGAY